ncbi:YihY/virulence factor BrkB family protein [Pontibacter sp. E15-1]|uniref:YihY/virulence factor BrkB family protein n=1 Tax=Pontibacter sp. E15-1 TaxID=2919918 RepID=UPI001F5035A1|nr:YihY/virulence factor BrkB family protein [Pontibacter sp. E15-1]MCJ8163879.1 YihY/virulence factor BrkB family protein [Pontibacter sp. E15-1]
MADYTMRGVFDLIKRSGSEFSDNDSLRLAAALAFNAIFSIPPLLIIIIRAAGFFFGEEAVSGKLANEISTAVGPEAAEEVQKIVENAQINASGIHLWIGIGTLLFASTTFFATLQQSLNSIWNLKVKPTNGILRMAKERVFSFGIILSIAFLMLMSFVISAVISILSDFISRLLPADIWYWAIKLVDFVVSVGLITFLFALIYKYLPDAYIRWRDTLIGALVTAVLFTIGKLLISWYLSTSDPGSAYGAAGSVILILVWIYYSSLIIFFGAEFTQQYAEEYGQRVRPKPHAVFVEQREVVNDPQDANSGRPRPQGRFEPK